MKCRVDFADAVAEFLQLGIVCRSRGARRAAAGQLRKGDYSPLPRLKSGRSLGAALPVLPHPRRAELLSIKLSDLELFGGLAPLIFVLKRFFGQLDQNAALETL